MKAGDRLPRLSVGITARTVVMGAVASRDWQPQHHDHAWAVERAGTRDIFLNTPTQAGWIERYLTDWTGPYGRLGRLAFKMRKPVCPGDVLVFEGAVRAVEPGRDGCTFADVDVSLTVDGEVATRCSARIAVPASPGDNPWSLDASRWRP